MPPALVQQNQAPPVKAKTPLDKSLLTFGQDIYTRDSKNRFAEDREWYQAALFYQLKQWLTIKQNRWQQIDQNPNKPIPMPVSDYFSKTINANANSLGAKIPDMVAAADDSSAANRRAAEAAEAAFVALDKESGMDILNPVLAKQTTLWGMGCVKDTVDTSEATGMDEIPGIDMQANSIKVCPQCGYVAVGGQPDAQAAQPADSASPFVASAPAPAANAQPIPDVCPVCGGQLEDEQLLEPQAGTVNQYAKGKIRSDVVKIFEIYLPRNVRDPNLTPILTHRYRKNKEQARSLFPNEKDFTLDESRDVSQFYVDSLGSLVLSSTEQGEQVTFTETWADWSELTDEVRKELKAEWGMEPSQVIGYETLTRYQAVQKYGIYFTWVSGKILAKSENPWDGKKLFTFFPWEKDPASPYPVSLAARLIPLQKQLNRLDCLMELSEQTNSVGKWIVPNTQQGTVKVSGSPHDVMWWDPIGDGKTKPEFILPNPYGPALPTKRQQILADFEKLGYTEGVGAGEAPQGVKSFRGIAYLGAKAEENIATQRFLWEQAHRLRKEKLLIMAQKVWDEPRKAKVAGFNGKFGMKELTGRDLQGNYGISAVKDSSRPKTRSEKMQSLQIGAASGLIDMRDPQNREFVLDELELHELNQTDHYNYVKFDRDLEVLKAGQVPFEVPSQKWDIWVQGIGAYMLTEEFEELDVAVQHGIVMYFQYCSDKLTAVTQGVPPDPMLANKLFHAAVSGNGDQGPLGGIPGETVSPQQAEKGAATQGSNFAASQPGVGAAA